MPKNGRQRTIDSPDSVSLVVPPSTTMRNTMAQHTSSHIATALSFRDGVRDSAWSADFIRLPLVAPIGIASHHTLQGRWKF
jgi:hypothetical protein